jgi:TPR repeat protein
MAAQLLTTMPTMAASEPQTEASATMFEDEENVHVLAERGDPAAQYELGTTYAYGMGLKQDFAEAQRWLERAAAQGHAWSQYELGKMRERGHGGPADPAQALTWYEQAAAQGEGRAALRAGHLRRAGADVPWDVQASRRWLTLAAGQNIGEAQLELALLLASLEEAPARDEAIAWLERAASQEPLGRLLLADMRERLRSGRPTTPSAMGADWASHAEQPEAALKHALAARYGIGEPADEGATRRRLERLVGQGNAAAMAYLADMMVEGLGGPEDPKSAKALYRRAATLGDGPAQLAMAGVEIMDDDKSLAWLRKAAAQGLPEAQAALGMTLAAEDETRQEGRAWLSKAAHQGHAEAAYGLTSDRGSGIFIGEEQRSEAQMKWLRFAAERGVSQAQQALGRSLLEGDQPAEGRAWLERAAAQRDNNAALALADAYLEGKGGAKDVAAASRWYLRAYALGDPNGLFRQYLLLHGPEAASLPHAELLPPIRREAAKGNAFGQYMLGRMHHLGLGVPRDTTQALRLYTLAASGNFEGAQVALGRMHAEGDGVPRDDAAAIAWFQKAIANESAQAKIHLARMLRDGRGVPKDVPQAVKLLEEAGYRGLGEGYHELGAIYEHGLGVPVDLTKAKSYYERAASDKWPAAQAHLKDFVTVGGQLRVVDGARYWEDLRRRAERGEPAAQLELGNKLLQLENGTRDVEGGVTWLTRAATQGHVPAQLELSELLFQGLQVQRGQDWVTVYQDPEAALNWLRRAAEGGSLEAQLALVGRLRHDDAADQVEAFRWALAAARAGHAEAQLTVAEMYADGTGTPVDGAQALAWAQSALKQGNQGAYMAIADMYRTGAGVPTDPAQAFAWMLKAAERGDRDAMYRVAEAYAEGEGVVKDLGRAAAWYGKAAEPYDSGRGGFSAARIYMTGPAGVKNEVQAHLWYLTGIDHWIEGGDGTEIFGGGEFKGFQQRYGSLPAAQYALAKRFESGDGLPRDLEQARAWYGRAAHFDRKYPKIAMMAHFKLATMEPGADERESHHAAGLALLKDQMANPFDFLAQLGVSWEFDRQFPVAMKALHQAAKAGYAPAQHELGWLLRTGRGVPRNEALGRQWQALAAKQGYLPARLAEPGSVPVEALARMVLAMEARPDGLTALGRPASQPPASYRRALAALQSAARAGKVGPFTPPSDGRFSTSLYMIADEAPSEAELKAFAKRQDISLAEAKHTWSTARLEVRARMSRTAADRLKWLREAAEQGSTSSMAQLAEAYRTGKGAPKDPIVAMKWGTLAQVAGVQVWDDKTLDGLFTAGQIAAGRVEAMRIWTQRHKIQLAP